MKGDEKNIEFISLWNRDQESARLNGVEVVILDKNRNSVWATKLDKTKKGENELDTKEPGNLKKVGKKYAKVGKAKINRRRRKNLFNISSLGDIKAILFPNTTFSSL